MHPRAKIFPLSDPKYHKSFRSENLDACVMSPLLTSGAVFISVARIVMESLWTVSTFALAFVILKEAYQMSLSGS